MHAVELRLSRAAREAAEAIRLPELGEAVRSLAGVVGAPQFVLCSFDDVGRFVLHTGAGDIADTFDTYIRGVYPRDPLQERLLQLARFPPIATHGALGVDVAGFRRSEAYQEYFRRIRVDRMLVCSLTDAPYGTPGAAGMMFTRPPDADDFAEADANAVAEVFHAFRAAARRHSRVAALERERDQLAAAARTVDEARLLFDPSGRVVWRSPVAEGWLPGEVPADLSDAAARLGGLAAGGPLERGTRSRLTCTIRDGRAVTADLSIVRCGSGAPLVEAVLDPAGLGPGLLAAAAKRYGLTPAEAQVLNALLRGETNPAAAKRLFVSLETVRTHVRRVLAKVGASSRHEVQAIVAGALGLPH
jgi:DNA-binding CsgD family transcriptional regulator